jgi:hypothetical protein
LTASALTLGACSANRGSPFDTASVSVAATVIPTDGQCTHIVVTRLADFETTEYKGLLSGATFNVPIGEDRVTATAYAQPCSLEPTPAPWVADPQVVTFGAGSNTLTLNFHQNGGVTIDPNFDNTAPLIVRAGSVARLARNGEDASGPNYSLDGWEVKQIALPPAAASETVLFTTENKGLGYSPRGMAHMPDGTFVFQLGEVLEPLHVFSAAGAPIATWRIKPYDPMLHQWDFTDGLEAIDATHFVRTGWNNRPFECDIAGEHCKQSGLDFLEKKVDTDGSVFVEITRQLFLPELVGAPLNLEFPVGVAPVGGNIAVTTLGDVNHLTLLNAADGSVVAGPVTVPSGDPEGLFDDGAGRLVALDYDGTLLTFNDTDLTARTGEQLSYAEGIGFANPFRITWRTAGNRYIVYNGNKIVSASPAFDEVIDTGFDAFAIGNGTIGGLDYRPDMDELLVIARVPPADTGNVPRVDFYNVTSHMRTTSVVLQTGLMVPLRPLSLAYVSTTQQVVTHFRQPNAANPALDATAYVHDLSGMRVRTIDVRPLGFTRILDVRYRALSNELVFVVSDATGVRRILTTDLAGAPHRSYRLDAIRDLSDLAPIGSGDLVGDFGVVEGQPSYFVRIALP